MALVAPAVRRTSGIGIAVAFLLFDLSFKFVATQPSITATEARPSCPRPRPAPTLRNAGLKPAIPRKLFVNIPVSDVQRSIRFFEELGFTFNVQFTDASATSMLVGEDAYFMLLSRERFQSFTSRAVGDPKQATAAMFALGVDSREAVLSRVRTQRWRRGMQPGRDGFPSCLPLVAPRPTCHAAERSKVLPRPTFLPASLLPPWSGPQPSVREQRVHRRASLHQPGHVLA